MIPSGFVRDNARWLGAGALLTFLSSFGQTFFISLFSTPIRADFSLSHGDWSTIYAVGTGVSALVMVWAGSLADIMRIRTLGILVLCGLSAACFLMAANTSAVVLALSVCLLRFFGQGMASHIAIVAMSRWFVATRGRALAICTLGFTVGELIFPILIVALLALVDWRWLWCGAAFVALIGVFCLFQALRSERTPQEQTNQTGNLGMDHKAWTRRDVVSHPLFWLMIPALLGPSAFNTAFFFHHAYYAETRQISQLALVSLFPIYTTLAVVAMIASGWLVDRYGSPRTLPMYLAPMILAFFVFSIADGQLLIALGLVFLALSAGANATLPNVFWAEFYGTQHIGSIKALAAAIMVLGSALGPLGTGVLIDSGVSLSVQFAWIAGFFGLATICTTFGVVRYRGGVPSYRGLRKYT